MLKTDFELTMKYNISSESSRTDYRFIRRLERWQSFAVPLGGSYIEDLREYAVIVQLNTVPVTLYKNNRGTDTRIVRLFRV